MKNVSHALTAVLLLLLPLQLNKYFWISDSLISGVRVDYVAPTVYFTDFIILLAFLLSFRKGYFLGFIKSHLFLLSCIASFFLFSFFSLMQSPHPFIGLFWTGKILLVFLFTFTLISSVREKGVFWVIQWFIFGMVWVSILGIAQFVFQQSVGFSFLGERPLAVDVFGIARMSFAGKEFIRAYGTFPHPNVFASYLVTALILIRWFPLRRLRLPFFALFLLALLCTGSRFFLLYYAGLIFVQVFQKTHSRKINTRLIVFLGALFLFLSFSYSFSLNEQSVQERLGLNIAAIQIIFQHPFWGVGPHQILYTIQNYYRATRTSFFLQPPHNAYLLLLSEVGVLGVIPVFFFMASVVLSTWKRHREAIPLLLVIILGGMIDHFYVTLHHGLLLVAFIFSLCVLIPPKKVFHESYLV